MVEFAEDIGHYWRTSKSGPDVWIERAGREIEAVGGAILKEAFGREGSRAAYFVEFELDGDTYKIVWPVLPSKTGDERNAKVQAATLLYHDVKAKVLSAKVLGTRAAFFPYLELPDGRTASQASMPELMTEIPAFLQPSPYPQLPSGDR